MDREQAVQHAENAEQSEAAQEVVLKNMSEIAKEDIELTVVERGYLFGAYNNVINSLQASRKEASSTSQKQDIEQNIIDKCNGMLRLLENYLIRSASSGEAKVAYRMIAGDINAYLAKLTRDTGNISQGWVEAARNYYDGATEIARPELPPTHPTRLGLSLNYANFYHDILDTPDKAISLAKMAFDDAIAELDTLSEENYQASTRTMSQLQEKLRLWDPAGSN
ncbi:14-3-3 family protein ArtA [Penicillium sp. IBT 35674x]|nr:14-3-3 family protein ArtA [Penicillium sp. IBT 35674x]